MELLNNSSEMKTVVETFVIEETASLIYDNEKLDKWNELVSELGLQGQTKITKPKKSPIPFMHMKDGMVNIFETLCPRKVSVEDYDKTPIPVEILDLIALSKREEYFSKIEVWYDDKSPDPAVIGMTSKFYVYKYDGVPSEVAEKTFNSKKLALQAIREIKPDFPETSSFGWETDKNFYLLGKWADVKHSFVELKEMAKARFMESRGAELRSTIKQSQRELDDLESEAVKMFN